MGQWWWAERYILILVAVFVILGVIYSVTVPLWESPDEVANFGYVAHLVRTRSLPVQQIGVLDAAHHPPLYFAVAALVSGLADLNDPTGTYHGNPTFVWRQGPGRDHNSSLHRTAETFPYHGIALAVHLARWVSVGVGAITVAFTYAIARHIFPQSQGLALLAASVTAFNPQFLFISGSVSLDGMVAMTCALALWHLMRALEKPFRWQGWALTGSFCGLAVLSKSSAFTVGLTAGILLLVSAVRQRSWRLLWRGALALGLAFLVVSGWWFARNWVLYGDPLGWQVFFENWVVHHRNSRIKWKDVHRFFTIQFRSYWALFGWATISAPKWVYRLLQALGVLSLVGWGKWLWRRRWRSLDEPRALGLIALVTFPLLQEGFQFRSIFTFNDSWYQGRHLFPVIAALSTLLAAGLWRPTLNRIGRAVSLASGIALCFLAVVAPYWIIRPEYTTPTLAKWQVWALPHRSDVVFGEQLRLLGYRVKSAELPDHRDVTMTLYWQAVQHPELDYSVFVHVINEAGELVTQSDIGLGSDRDYPSSAWWVEDIVTSQHTLVVSPDLPAGAYEIQVGVYFWADGARLPAVEEGVYVGDSIALDALIIGNP